MSIRSVAALFATCAALSACKQPAPDLHTPEGQMQTRFAPLVDRLANNTQELPAPAQDFANCQLVPAYSVATRTANVVRLHDALVEEGIGSFKGTGRLNQWTDAQLSRVRNGFSSSTTNCVVEIKQMKGNTPAPDVRAEDRARLDDVRALTFGFAARVGRALDESATPPSPALCLQLRLDNIDWSRSVDRVADPVAKAGFVQNMETLQRGVQKACPQ